DGVADAVRRCARHSRRLVGARLHTGAAPRAAAARLRDPPRLGNRSGDLRTVAHRWSRSWFGASGAALARPAHRSAARGRKERHGWRGGGTSTPRSRDRTGGAPFVLLVGAGLLLASFRAILHIDPGFQPEGVVTATVSLSWPTYRDDAALTSY